MNAQVRKLFAVVLGMFLILGAAATYIQVLTSRSLMEDPRNSRTILQAAERDRGPLIVQGNPVAYSQRLDDGTGRYERIYPQGAVYAPVTGYYSVVSMNATGMEQAVGKILEGDTSQLFKQRIRNLFAGKPRQGGGVELTLDAAMQEKAAELLDGRQGAVVVEEATTGRILALYSSPSFDPNPLASFDTAVVTEADEALQADPSKPLENRAIAADTYAPGSVFKIITAAAMLENGVAADTVLDSPVTMTLPGTEATLSNIDSSECGSGQVTLTEAFARSCNTTFALAAGDLPPELLDDVAARFGFGQEIQIPLKVVPSAFPPETTPAELATSAIGQFEVAVTPLQMAMVAQAVANGGDMMRPYLMERILDADNQEISVVNPESMGNPISPEVAASLNTMMQAVVNEPYGTGWSMGIEGIPVAGKTGTAEVGDGSRSNAWAVAFAPADNPQYVVSVVVEGDDYDPLPHGGDVAGPIARQLLEVGLW